MAGGRGPPPPGVVPPSGPDDGKQHLLYDFQTKDHFDRRREMMEGFPAGWRDDYPCWVPPDDVPSIARVRFGLRACAPHFIIGGAMKCGTTSLWEYLLRHPAVMPLRNEYLLPYAVRNMINSTIGKDVNRIKRHRRNIGKDNTTIVNQTIVYDEKSHTKDRRLQDGFPPEPRRPPIKRGDPHAGRAPPNRDERSSDRHIKIRDYPGDKRRVKKKAIAKQRRNMESTRKKAITLKRFIRPIIGKKEVRFFDGSWWKKANKHASDEKEAVSWYYNVFPIIPHPESAPTDFDENRGMIAGEASPTYINSKGAPDRVGKFLPEGKVIFMLRNPADRVFSQMNMQKDMADEIKKYRNRTNRNFTDFDEAVDWSRAGQRCWVTTTVVNGKTSETKRVYNKTKLLDLHPVSKRAHVNKLNKALNASLYYYAVKQWSSHVKEENLLFIRSEDFYKDTIKVMHQVEEFLGIPRLTDEQWGPIVGQVYNLKLDGKTREFDPKAVSKKDLHHTAADKDRLKMSEESRAALDDFYEKPNQDLKELLAPWGFPGWKRGKQDTGTRDRRR